ncbi:MAG: hypothetical protein PVG19_04930 [Desulfobacterales bacterium]|jgi:hypothetical protein
MKQSRNADGDKGNPAVEVRKVLIYRQAMTPAHLDRRSTSLPTAIDPILRRIMERLFQNYYSVRFAWLTGRGLMWLPIHSDNS